MAFPSPPEQALLLPTTAIATALAFVRRIEQLALADAPAPIDEALSSLQTTRDVLQWTWVGLERAARTDRRPIDNAADVAWQAFYDRLDAYGRLPPERYPRAAQANALRISLFPDGMSFLGARYDTQWAEMNQRVQRIEREGLRPDLEALCGAEHVAELLRTFREYRRIVASSNTDAEALRELALAEPLRELVRATGDYRRELLAWLPETHGETRLRVRAALSLYDELGEAAARIHRGAGARDTGETTGEGSRSTGVDRDARFDLAATG